MNSEALKTLVETALDDMKGQAIVSMEVGEISNFADYMLVVTGTSNRHVKSLADEVSQKIKAAELPPARIEGLEQGEWVLLDVGDVVVHIMLADTRKLYDLESLWALGNSRGE